MLGPAFVLGCLLMAAGCLGAPSTHSPAVSSDTVAAGPSSAGSSEILHGGNASVIAANTSRPERVWVYNFHGTVAGASPVSPAKVDTFEIPEVLPSPSGARFFGGRIAICATGAFRFDIEKDGEVYWTSDTVAGGGSSSSGGLCPTVSDNTTSPAETNKFPPPGKYNAKFFVNGQSDITELCFFVMASTNDSGGRGVPTCPKT